MLERFERPIKIICLGLAALLLWEIANLFLSVDPLANLKIPPLPTLPGTTNEPAKGTNAPMLAKNGTNGTNATISTNVAKGTNLVKETNMVEGTNVTRVADGTNNVKSTNLVTATNLIGDTNALAKSTNAPVAGKTNSVADAKAGGSKKSTPNGGTPNLPPGMTPEMLASLPPEVRAQIMAGGGGMPGGRQGGGATAKVDLPPDVKAHVDRIVDSEIFGPVMHPMPMALLGILDEEALIQATNGQSGPVKVGGEMGGIKLLRIGINRVLIEANGEKKELTIFDGAGGQSLMPKETSAPATNSTSTNAPSTNAPGKKLPKRMAAASNAPTNQTISSKQKEIP